MINLNFSKIEADIKNKAKIFKCIQLQIFVSLQTQPDVMWLNGAESNK